MSGLVRRLPPVLFVVCLVAGWTAPAVAQTECGEECAASATPSPTATPEGPPTPSPAASPTPVASPTPTPTPSEANPGRAEGPAPSRDGATKRLQAAGSVTVSMVDNAFQPRSISVQPGTTVTWTNNGEVIHTATADAGGFDSGVMGVGDTFSFTFSQPGTFAYYCQLHGAAGGVGMAGAVVVQGAADDSSTPGSSGGESAPEDESVAPATAVEGNLPTTGPREVLPLTVLGAILIVVGAALVRGRRGPPSTRRSHL